MTDRRYPLVELVADMGVTLNKARRQLGVSGSRWTRMLELGLTEIQADRLAARAGMVDVYVWPELVEHRIADLEAAERLRAERRRAQWRAAARRKRERHGENERARVAAYRAQHREGLNAARRRYYSEHRLEELARQSAYGHPTRAKASA